ncbi:hypothetical protein B0H66DRAFT_603751 [Apodospora peruviana]|uniref:Uncharacterized protein n=1 Tax=Apodospora peruviana TaxID=516989 RepID=A0AAE0I651_9PEZI|nr:hypothetical protein B0H66DRAFT_603751 [Apodospora peruviana]
MGPAIKIMQNFEPYMERSTNIPCSSNTEMAPEDTPLGLAESMLRYDASWAGPRKNGFRHEMETANLNLSLVEAPKLHFSTHGSTCFLD